MQSDRSSRYFVAQKARGLCRTTIWVPAHLARRFGDIAHRMCVAQKNDRLGNRLDPSQLDFSDLWGPFPEVVTGWEGGAVDGLEPARAGEP